jgi:hypothetical protein
MFQGHFLRVIKETAILPEGMVVYCFVDEGHQFRVRTDRDVHGVREVIMGHDKRAHFVVYS